MSMKTILASGAAVMAMAAFTPSAAMAQDKTLDGATPTGAIVTKGGDEDILVTGSRIKQNPNDSALPLQIITTQELERNGISSPEQFVAFLTDNGTGADNLASNSDVIANDKRGTNGLSAANLRGQGPAATLVLLNGRRVAAHGLSGSAVDVNQIPFMAIDRIEVLKDGASAIYGTDAVGGVINFITKKNYKGFGANAYADVSQLGDSPIYRASAIAGYGDLDKQGFNIMATVGYSWVSPLYAKQRDFINTFQHDRGLGVDTRGTPFATIVSLAGTAFPTSGSLPLIPGTTVRATGGINVLRLPGQPGCSVGTDMADYDTDVWGNPANGLACSFDTGRNVYLQQKLNTLTYYGRGTLRLGPNELSIELTGSDADSDKRFSQIQITPASSRNYSFKLVPGVNDAKYNYIYNTIKATFPTLAIPYGAGFSYRWRCLECGEREIFTNSKTFRASVGLQGPLFDGWDYQAGAFYAESQSKSTLGSGYYYQTGLVNALNSGYVDPFLLPGETQSAAGLAALQSASAEGVVLYGGKYTVKAADASVSGTLFDLWGRGVKLAAGVDYRREEYKFNGDERAVQTTIFAAPFDNGNALDGVHRDIKAAYAEILIPLFKGFEFSAAGRIDDYTGFGTTTNPKLSVKYRPVNWLLFRGSYNTAFRVPTFNQIFNPQSSSTYSGADYADPRKCPGGVVNVAAGCPALSNSNGTAFEEIFGGNPNLGPETAKEWSGGLVFEPSKHFSLTADYWSIHRENTIQSVALRYLFQNYEIFKDRFVYDSAGNLESVNETLANVGATKTEGIDFTVRASYPLWNGNISAGLDGTWLLKKTSQVNASAATIDELGTYTQSGDLGLEWKHNAFIAWSNDGFGVSLTQIYRSGYDNQILPGVLAKTFNPCCDTDRVKPYVIYNLSWYVNVNEQMKLTFGVKNLFDKDPPFAISYSSDYGSGSDWEPRVADPRGRSFNMSAQVKF